MGAAGGVMMFFLLMVGMVIIGAYVFAYAAHILLSVIESTSTGFEEVAWPDEPYVDWLWKGAYVFWLVALWLVPLLFVGQALSRTQTSAVAAAQFVYVTAALFWLLFPISLLSSMSASSRWIVFSPAVLPRLAKRSGSLFIFYALTGPLLAGVAFVVWWASRGADIISAPVAAFAVAAGLLIYGRLFGRLALLVRHTSDREDRVAAAPVRRARDRRPIQVRAAAYDPVRSGRRIVQPSELPPTEARDPDARTGYDVRLDDSPAAESGLPPGHGWIVADPPEPYAVADGPHTVDPPRGPMPEQIVKPSEYEQRLARTDKSPGLPEHPWSDGTFAFPFYAANRGPLVWLTLGLSAFGMFFMLMMSFKPA
jgi:hypothetical protein